MVLVNMKQALRMILKAGRKMPVSTNLIHIIIYVSKILHTFAENF